MILLMLDQKSCNYECVETVFVQTVTAKRDEERQHSMLDEKRRETAFIPPKPAPRETLQDHVYNRVKDLILSGDIAPGQTITMKNLATAFEVSHMPVREALHRLTAEKALTVVAGRSVGIPPLSANKLEDLRRVRIEVEGMAAEWATARITDAAIAQLEELNEALGRSVTEGDVKGYLRANRDFHFALYRAAESSTLFSIIESLWLQISPYFNLLHESGNYAEANQHHDAVTKALRGRDASAARDAIQADIAEAAKVLQAQLA